MLVGYITTHETCFACASLRGPYLFSVIQCTVKPGWPLDRGLFYLTTIQIVSVIHRVYHKIYLRVNAELLSFLWYTVLDLFTEII